MASFFTLYITNKTIETKYRRYVGLVDSWSSNTKLDKLNVGVGDSVYWVSILNGSLYVISALRVGKKLSYADFSKQHGKDLADAWEHGEAFYIASQATTIAIDRDVSPGDAKQIRFESNNDRLKFNPPGSNDLDPQTLRVPRRLTPNSASILDDYLGDYVQVSGNHITAWKKFFETIPTNITEIYHVHNDKGEFGYIPIREDYDNARRKCLREGKERVSYDDILDVMQNDLEKAGYRLAENWRLVTKDNIEKWEGLKET
jgi:hypothetical protein